MSTAIISESGPISATAFLILAVASIIKLLIKEGARNARFNVALKDSQPEQRPEIILATSQFEGVSNSDRSLSQRDHAENIQKNAGGGDQPQQSEQQSPTRRP